MSNYYDELNKTLFQFAGLCILAILLIWGLSVYTEISKERCQRSCMDQGLIFEKNYHKGNFQGEACYCKDARFQKIIKNEEEK